MKIFTAIEEDWAWDGARHKLEIGPYSAYVYCECSQNKGFLYFKSEEIAHVRYPASTRLLSEIMNDIEAVIQDHHKVGHPELDG